MKGKLQFTLCFAALSCMQLQAQEENSNYEETMEFSLMHADLSSDMSVLEDFLFISDQPKKKKKRWLRLTRSDQIPADRLKGENASYLEGYIQALIDANYYELLVIVYVDNDHVVYLYNLPKDERIKQSIIAFVSDLPDVKEVKEGKANKEVNERIEEKKPVRYHIQGVWFPESTVLFQPLVASPREPVYSLAYRWGDRVLAKEQVAVSLGDIFPIFRFFNILPAHGDLQIDIAACMWANFDMNPTVHPSGEWAELVTTDYLLSIPVTYAFDQWAFRLRVYHISSHLGDEYMVNHPTVLRVNPSFEALEFMTSYQFTDGFRGYLGPAWIISSDDSYALKHTYFEYGVEWRFSGLKYHYHRLYGSPFLAVDMQHWQANNFRPSLTAQLGYEWSKLQGAGRKVRLFGEYHDGYSEGQFFKQRTRYGAIRVSWGF